jgi:hypothetical protein
VVKNRRDHMYHNFIWGKFKDLEDLPEYEKDKLTTIRQFNDRIEKIYSRLPANTAFIVSSGSGDAREWEKYVVILYFYFVNHSRRYFYINILIYLCYI